MIDLIGNRRCFGGLVDPLPTMFREVSGSRKIMIDRHDPAAMHKNQNIQVQPAA